MIPCGCILLVNKDFLFNIVNIIDVLKKIIKKCCAFMNFVFSISTKNFNGVTLNK